MRKKCETKRKTNIWKTVNDMKWIGGWVNSTICAKCNVTDTRKVIIVFI